MDNSLAFKSLVFILSYDFTIYITTKWTPANVQSSDLQAHLMLLSNNCIEIYIASSYQFLSSLHNNKYIVSASQSNPITNYRITGSLNIYQD